MCNECREMSGYVPGKNGGWQRCACTAEHVRLADEYRNRPPNPNVTPRVTEQQVVVAVEMLAAIPHFPRDTKINGARLIIAKALQHMCLSADSMMWLAGRMVDLYDTWPGVREMRIVYCSKYVPLDGIQPSGGSGVYLDGIPSERGDNPPQLLPGGAQGALPPGRVVSKDPAIDNALVDAAARKDLNRGRKP